MQKLPNPGFNIPDEFNAFSERKVLKKKSCRKILKPVHVAPTINTHTHWRQRIPMNYIWQLASKQTAEATFGRTRGESGENQRVQLKLHNRDKRSKKKIYIYILLLPVREKKVLDILGEPSKPESLLLVEFILLCSGSSSNVSPVSLLLILLRAE